MTYSPLLLIRADATAEMGVGHVMRCLALAQAWARSGGVARFVSRCEGGVLNDLLAGHGFEVVIPEGAHRDPGDIESLLREAARGADWIVVDGYHFDTRYQTAIRQAGFRLMVVDDMNHLDRYDADIVFNQNPGGPGLGYSTEGILLAGTGYVWLREEFLARGAGRREHPARARRVLLTMGGGDGSQALAHYAGALSELEGLEVRIPVGPAGGDASKVLEGVSGRGNTVFEVLRCPSMPDLMAWADVAVSAAGSTCWELAYMGVPMALSVLADNQEGIARELGSRDAALLLGAPGEQDDTASVLADFFSDASARSTMARNARSLVDGRGADRTVAAMREFA